jgi:hypothetical protein
VSAGDRAEHQDDREQPGRCRGRVLEQFEPGLVRGELLGGDPGADHERGEERRAEQFGEQAAGERRVGHERAAV